MSFGQGGSQSQWDPWKPHSQQPGDGGGDDGTPDWAALAEASEARKKRRRLLFVGGGVLATVAVGAAVAVAVMSANGDDHASGGPHPTATATSPSGSATAPSFAPTSAPPPLDPKDFISSAKKDTAALGADTLFPAARLTMNGTVYQKGPTADTRDCASAAQGTLAKVLTDNGCTRLIRATYTRDGISATVGVAVFDTEAQATRAKGQADRKSIVKPLAGGGVKAFCDGAVCRSTTNSYGRYAYFTLTGFPSGKNVTTKDTEAFGTGDDLAEFAFGQIRRRGEAQASAAADQ
ncbi:hypothetical protein ACF061_08000 [Streptomyces sp. NPDC015220]|uniref:hypothetical protein n=1 Tax=Streptomyces sp. NPDC015220 TaxID=3364947 RepID=UPI0036FCF2D3